MEHNIAHDELAQLEEGAFTDSFQHPVVMADHSFAEQEPEEPIGEYGQGEVEPDAIDCSLQDL